MTEKEHPGVGDHQDKTYTGRKPVKMIFPVGIFFMLFFIESLIAAGASLAYFYYIGRSGLAEIESNTRSCSVPIAEAFGSMAEMCYRTRNYSRLRTLFREKTEQRIISEAFFVLKNGRVIAHSDPAVYESLKGNLASDELAYNMDLILRPVAQKSRDVFFTEYNIVSKPAPFKREYRLLLKRYFYRNIDSTGWLASRAVFGKKKPVGAVCFIIGKERIYSFLIAHINRCAGILFISLAVACAVSLLVTLVVMARYRSIQKRSLAASTGEERPSGAASGEFYDMTIMPAGPEPFDTDMPVVVEILNEPYAGEGTDTGMQGTPFHHKREIKDAISVEEKE
jgi:hypothetical protein